MPLCGHFIRLDCAPAVVSYRKHHADFSYVYLPSRRAVLASRRAFCSVHSWRRGRAPETEHPAAVGSLLSIKIVVMPGVPRCPRWRRHEVHDIPRSRFGATVSWWKVGPRARTCASCVCVTASPGVVSERVRVMVEKIGDGLKSWYFPNLRRPCYSAPPNSTLPPHPSPVHHIPVRPSASQYACGRRRSSFYHIPPMSASYSAKAAAQIGPPVMPWRSPVAVVHRLIVLQSRNHLCHSDL